MSKLRELAMSQKFSKGSKMEAALANAKSTDKQIAEAALKTKPYKENAEFKAAVDAVLAPAPASASKEEKPETPKASSRRSGEYR